jgi:hypothetical protein
MPKTNEFKLTGNVSEIESKFLQNGAEVCDIVLTWDEASQYPGMASINFYAAKGLDKLNKLEIKVGNNVTIPCTAFSKVKEGVSTKTGESYRFFETKLRGDSWAVVVNGGGAKADEAIEF